MELNLMEIVYNHKYKEAFIETLENDKYKEQAIGLFRKTKSFEEELNKDIYDMRPSELNDVIKSLRFTSFNSAIRDVKRINKYNLWAMVNGYCTNMAIKEIDTNHKNLRKYIYKNFNSVYSECEIIEATQNMSKRLGLIAELIFHGLKGATDLNEIRYLKVEHLHEKDDKYFIELDRGDIEIPHRLYEELIRFNSSLIDSESGSKYIESEYIFKQIDRGSNEDKGIIIRKTIGTSVIASLKEALRDNTVTQQTLRYSGFNYYAYKLMEESGQMILTKDILKQLASRYKVGINTIGFWNYNALLDWVYEDKIKEFYGEFEFSDEF